MEITKTKIDKEIDRLQKQIEYWMTKAIEQLQMGSLSVAKGFLKDVIENICHIEAFKGLETGLYIA